jgi:ABC-2 type transport system ATP-binding protein
VPTAALTLESVTRRFRAGVPGCSAEVTALCDVSLQVARGECVGIIGGAGSGKTTLLMCAAGLLAPDVGSVRSARSAYASALGVAHPFLGVRASLEFAASVRELEGDSTEPDIDRLLARTGLSETGRSRIGTLTPGMRARVVVAHLLLGEPQLLCIDDPLSLLSAAERLHFASLIRSLCSDGVAVVFSARDLALCDGITTRVVLLQGGRVIAARPPRRTLELNVGAPRLAASALSARLPSVMRRGRAVRVALDRISAEEVLAACVALGISVTGSRVINVRQAPGRVAERDTETNEA